MKLKKGEENNFSKVLTWIENQYEEPFFPPGTKAQYSNIGYDILGALIEKIAGESYASFLKTRIFDPLQMTTAEVRPVVVLDDRTGYATPRLLTWKGRKEKKFSYAVTSKDYTEPCAAMGSYGVYISIADLMKLRKFWGTDVLLSAKNREGYTVSAKLPDGKPNYWRYGCLSTKTPHLESSNIRMGGSQPGFLSFIIFYPEYDLTIAMITNSSPMYNRYVFSPNVINNYKEIKPILYRAFSVEVPEKEAEK
jgi:CubicO group peptidase (beta-lactamase class C family)